MKNIATNELLPGMVLATDVATPNLNKIALKGTIISSKDIAKFVFYSIKEVAIEDTEVDAILSELPPSDELTSSQRLRQTQEFKTFKNDFEICAQKYEDDIKQLIAGNAEVDTNLMLEPVYALLKQGRTTSDVFSMLHLLRNYDDATYTHCINVALTTNILAQWLKWSDEEVKIATLSGLFHDIGKITIPESIITKPGKLTDAEYTIVKTHPQRGYDALKDLDISYHVKNAALMHHERFDGTGYPSGLSGPQIDTYAKMVAITDVYDAMTSARHYRRPMCPFVVISTFEEEAFRKYDPEMVMCFIQNIVHTYLLSTVRLNTGEVGEIVFINKTYLSKPTIKIDDNYIDLSKCPGVFIEEIL